MLHGIRPRQPLVVSEKRPVDSGQGIFPGETGVHHCLSALPEALHNTHLEWRSPSLSPVLQDEKPNKRVPKREAETPPAPPPKRERMVKSDAFQTISMLRGGKKICKPFNDGRGCKGGCQNAHVCDVKLSSGKPCASSSHNRLNHPAE